MRVGNGPADDRSLPADFTPLRHDFLWKTRTDAPDRVGRKLQIVVDGQGMINDDRVDSADGCAPVRLR